VHSFISPIIAALPLVIRLLQCARRYYDGREIKHLVNLGKYVAAIVVVIAGVASGHESIGAILLVSVLSTYYSASWDTVMDFGLAPQDLAVPLPSRRRIDEPLAGVQRQARDRPLDMGRFAPMFYWTAVLSNLLMRHAWVLSLLPITILSSNIFVREGFKIALAAVEIARRAQWAILRFEHEQLVHADSRHAVLWVPAKLLRIGSG